MKTPYVESVKCIKHQAGALKFRIKCPQSLIAPLIQIVIDETRKSCKKQPTACGFNPSDNAYEPLKLMQTVMAKTNEICLRYLDNSMLCSLPSPGQPHNVVSVCAAKNKRRRMEDRHVVIHDLNTMFNIQEASPSSYYAIFDGHAGHDAAAYSAAHLHQFLAESKHFATNPEQALIDAFCKTDSLFIDKCNVERFNSGTTAVCALLRPKEKSLYIAWVGDSQALLVNQGRVLQCVNPHKPCRTDERERIEKEGGYICYWGTWRVNGQLAVSRAIGDAEYKPYVIAVPEIREIPLDGGEDFLILACDGLWDFLSEDDAARTVYNMVCECPDKTDLIGEHLVYLSKERGSADNISVIVVFLREPSKIAAEAHWANRNASPIMDTSLDNANNPFANSNGAADNSIIQKSDGLLLNLSENFKHNGGADLSPAGDFYHNNAEKANGKRLASEFDDDDDDDLGPETDVDAVDDVLSPSIVAAKALADGIVNNNPDGSFNPFVEKHEVEKAALEIDLDLQKQQSSEFDGQRSPREETPTPPADAVHDGGLEENLGDSGEESEDEWNYIKGEEANKENINPTQPDCEVADLLEDPDNMSQLNPNAAEFVPVSPTRSIPSPVCRALIDDAVIAQSPKRPSDIDINLPHPQDFEKEVKSRPSDFDSSFSNGHDHESEHKSPSQELMENLLNGKNIDEIPEFQPGNTPTKVPSSNDEFHFGPNAAPFTPAKLLDQSEAGLSTKALFGDESACNLDSTFDTSSKDNVDFIAKKDDDPMSMSFYQDKSDDNDPFDLNKVQILPENLDEFLAQPDEKNDTISDLPPKDLLGDEIVLNNDERIQTTDLDNEKELASPVSNDEDLISGTCELPKSAIPVQNDNILVPEVCQRPESKSEDVFSLPETKSPELLEVSSPEPEIKISSPEPSGEVYEISKSPEVCSLPKTPEPIEQACSLPKSPEPEKIVVAPEPEDDRKEVSLDSPLEDVTSSVKDVDSPIPDQITDIQLNYAQEIKNAVQATVPVEASSPIREDNLLPDLVLEKSTPKSLTDTESVNTADINSFLERSQVSDLASPLSPGAQPLILEDGSMNQDHPLNRCVYPLPTEFKTETITPEFAEPAVITPKEDTSSAATPPGEDIKESGVEDRTMVEEAGAVGAVAVATAAAVTEKKASKTKTPTTATTKKATPKSTPSSAKAASPTKARAAAPVAAARTKVAASKPTPPRTSTSTTTPKSATTTTKASPKPKSAATTTASGAPKPKPLTNGDVKAPIRSTLASKSSVKAATKPPSATTTKPSPTKTTATRPTTAPVRTVTKTTTTTAAPRPNTLTAKTGTGATRTVTSTLRATTTSQKPRETTARPPRPATAPANKPKLPPTKTVSKTVGTDKANKDSANKLTASRTVTASRTGVATTSRTTTSTQRKSSDSDAKTSGLTRTTSTKTTTTTRTTTVGKKPQELTRTVANKTKTTKVEKPVLNGVSTTVVTEQINVGIADNSSQLLVKDNSPIDNKLLVESNATD